jgi:hypothetical protein
MSPDRTTPDNTGHSDDLSHRIADALAAHPALRDYWSDDPYMYIDHGIVADVLDALAPEPTTGQLRNQILAEQHRHMFSTTAYGCSCGWKVDRHAGLSWAEQYWLHVAQSVVDCDAVRLLVARAARTSGEPC